MFNESQVKAAREDPQAKVHFLASTLSQHLHPGQAAYTRFNATIQHIQVLQHQHRPSCWWVPPPGEHTPAMQALASFQQAYANLSDEETPGPVNSGNSGIFLVMQHLYGAMAALAHLCCYGEARPGLTKVHKAITMFGTVQLNMLAGLLVFGPINFFTANKKGSTITTAVSRGLLELGCNVVEAKRNNGSSSKLPPNFLDIFRIEFLQFLLDMGFGDADDVVGFQNLKSWELIHAEFHKRFSLVRVAKLLSDDLELALSKMPS